MTLRNAFDSLAVETTQQEILTELQTQQKNALTNAELRLTPVNVNTGLQQPTTPQDIQPVSVQNQISGFATSDKQLPDNHNVTVSNQVQQPLTNAELRLSPVPVDTGLIQPTTPSDIQPVIIQNQISGFATSAKQLPDNHNVTVSNQVQQPLTNAELRLSPVDTNDSSDTEYLIYAGTITEVGDTPVITPAAGKRIVLRWVYAINDPTASAATKITIKIGSQIKYVAWAISKRQKITGELNQPVIINLSNAGDVAVTIFYQEI